MVIIPNEIVNGWIYFNDTKMKAADIISLDIELSKKRFVVTTTGKVHSEFEFPYDTEEELIGGWKEFNTLHDQEMKLVRLIETTVVYYGDGKVEVKDE